MQWDMKVACIFTLPCCIMNFMIIDMNTHNWTNNLHKINQWWAIRLKYKRGKFLKKLWICIDGKWWGGERGGGGRGKNNKIIWFYQLIWWYTLYTVSWPLKRDSKADDLRFSSLSEQIEELKVVCGLHTERWSYTIGGNIIKWKPKE